MICYSTDPIEMGRIKDARPKYHKSKEEKLDGQIEECRRTGTHYQAVVQKQLSRGVASRIKKGQMKKINLNNLKRRK